MQLLLQGGHNPDLPLEWYEDLFRNIKERYPTFKLHALSPPEVVHLSRLSNLPVGEVLKRLIAAGMDSVPGGGAEILVDRVRKLLHCYGKATADEWIGKKYRQSFLIQPMIELALGLYFTATVFYALANGIYGTLPFLVLFQIGFLYTGLLSIVQQYAGDNVVLEPATEE